MINQARIETIHVLQAEMQWLKDLTRSLMFTVAALDNIMLMEEKSKIYTQLEDLRQDT